MSVSSHASVTPTETKLPAAPLIASTKGAINADYMKKNQVSIFEKPQTGYG